MTPVPGARLTLVVDRPVAVYSGMVPGFVAGQYRRDDLEIDVRPLALRAGARCIITAATGLDTRARRLVLDGRPADRVRHRVLRRGLDGGRARAARRSRARDPDAADRRVRRRAWTSSWPPRGPATPRASSWRARARAVSSWPSPSRPGWGRGAAGASKCSCSSPAPASCRATRRARPPRRGRGRSTRDRDPHRRPRDAGRDRIGASGRRRSAPRRRRGLGGGRAALPIFQGCGLETDEGGFVRVRPTLQCVGHDEVFAVGDCAAWIAGPGLAKAGVYAVRQGPCSRTT